MHIIPLQGLTVKETNAFLNNISQNFADIEQEAIEKQKAQDAADQAERDR